MINYKSPFLQFLFTCVVSASITITENTPKKLSFIFTMEDLSISSFRYQDSVFSQVSFKESNCQLYNESQVPLPSVSLYAGVPQTGAILIQFVSLESRRVVLDHPLRADPKGYASPDNSTPLFDQPWVSTVLYSNFRNLRAGRFFIRPFIYDPGSRVLNVCTRASCTILFPTTAAPVTFSRTYAGDYYAMLENMLLNFEVAKQWGAEKQRVTTKRRASSSGTSLLPSGETMVTFAIGDGFSGFNETTTHENGIVKIKGSDISSFFSAPVPMPSLALYASPREELSEIVPSDTAIPDGVTEIPLFRVDMNKNGLFDAEDYVLAYVSGIADWYHKTETEDNDSDSGNVKEWDFYLNRKVGRRHYWLRSNGLHKGMAAFSCAGTPESTLTMFENRIRYKKPVQLMGDVEGKGGIEWIWKVLNSGSPSFTQTLPLPDRNNDLGGYMRVNTTNSYWNNNFTVFFGEDSLSNDNIEWLPFPAGNDSVVVITLSAPSTLEIVSIDMRYSQPLDMGKRNALRIYSPHVPDSGLVRYQLSNIPAEKTCIFRISADESQIQLVDTILSGGSYSWVDTAGIGIQYVIAAESGFLATPAFEAYNAGTAGTYEIRDVRNKNNRADYIIVTHRNFVSEALRLAEHKASIGKFAFPRVVDVDDIYREFSGGNQDPAAIRNFLYYAAHFWTPAAAGGYPGPDYVLLMGGGNYDYKGYKTRESNFIPTAQIDMRGAYQCVEDFFSCLNAGDDVVDYTAVPSLFLGRISCQTISEARTVVDKIIEIEGPDADFTSWRNRILLVSDDDKQGDGADYIRHYEGNEYIESAAKEMRPALEVRKVILFEYPWNDLFQKPEASSALYNEINNGVAFVNYFGHGNERAWADENLLDNERVGNFHNKGKYPVISSFSCSVGYFDKPEMTCLSETMMFAPGAGAVATMASSRTAYADKNEDMARVFYSKIYENGGSRTLGQAFAETKAVENLKHYVLLGDPSLRYMAETDTIAITITTKEGKPLATDTLKALQTIRIKGAVLRNSVPNASFGTLQKPAFIQLAMYNPRRDSVTRKDGGTVTDPVYGMPGTPVYIGQLKFTNGTFEQEVLLPRNVTFKKPGILLTAYASWGGSAWGTGNRGGYIFSGSELLSDTNNTGPQISIRPVYDDSLWNTHAGFTDKISAFLPVECAVSVYDKNGIDVSGVGPDEGLSIELKGVIERQNINNKFTFDEGKNTLGHANIVFDHDAVKPGIYTLTVRAQDLLGKVSMQDFTLEVLSEEDFTLGHVFNYPNPVPVGGRTKIYFYHTNTSEAWYGGVEATIRIFTLSGRLIRIFRNARNGQEWDCTDQRGQRLPPNVYLYRVTVKMLNAGLSGTEKTVKSPVKKLVIRPPR